MTIEEIPADFNDLMEETDVPQEMVSDYVGTNRRWVRISIQLNNGRYRQTWFLVDTGATTCFLSELHRNGVTQLDFFNVRNQPVFETNACLGVRVRFKRSTDAENVNISNINLLGASFLNQFVLVDDFRSNYLKLLKQSDPAVEPFN